MKMAFLGAMRGLQRDWILTVLVMLCFSVGLFLVLGCSSYYIDSASHMEGFFTAYNENETRFLLRFLDSGFHEPSEADREIYQNLKSLLQNEKDDFRYFTFTPRYVHIKDFLGKDSCLADFEEGRPAREAMPINGVYHSSAKGIVVSPDMPEYFAIELVRGEGFDLKTDAVPVVLGDSYSGFYDLGDRFECSLKERTEEPLVVELVVAGFLKPNAAMLDPYSKDGSEVVSMDNLMLLPDSIFESVIIAQDLSGIAVTSNRAYDFLPLLDEAGFGSLEAVGGHIIRPVMNVSPFFKLEAEEYFDRLFTASLLILAATSLCLSINMVNRLAERMKEFAVHLISGAGLHTLRAICVLSVAAVQVISTITAVILSLTLGREVFTFGTGELFGVTVARVEPAAFALLFGLNLVILFLVSTVTIVKIQVTEYDTLLRGRE